jgi:lipopolysaccharide/colanic/teichoic acid biosynthesis glycosyltransferase
MEKVGLPERLLAAALLIFPISIILVLVWLAIKISAPSKPAFFRQERVGKDGKIFLMWKVRSLDRIDYEDAVIGPNDHRITYLGKVVRRSHIDECIQILNIINGTMKFFGPRPIIVKISLKLEKEIKNYHARHAVYPGITGLNQIKGRCEAKKCSL